MAYASKRKNGYIGRYRVDGILKSTKLFPTKRDALAEATAQETAGKSKTWVDPRKGTVTLSAYFEELQGTRSHVAQRTRDAERERFASLIAPTFGKTPLKQLDDGAIQTWALTMRAKRSGEVASQARRRDAVRLLVAILDTAHDAKRIPSNPARTRSGKVPYLPKTSKSKAHRYLSHEQLRRVADAADGEQARALILFAGLTGLRWGEVSALRVSDVDLVRKRVAVRRAYTRLDSGKLVLGDTKTHASREVPIGTALLRLVEEQLRGKAKGSLLFATDEGEPLRREGFGRYTFGTAVRVAGHAVSALQRLLGFDEVTVSGVYDAATIQAVNDAQRRHGLPETGVCDPATWAVLAEEDRERRDAARRANGARDGSTRGPSIRRTRQLKALSRTTLAPGAEDFPTLTLHDLRHTAASLAIASGASVKGVQRLLGHASASLTLDTYAGLFDSDLDALGAALSNGFDASGFENPAHHLRTGAAEVPAGVTPLRSLSAL